MAIEDFAECYANRVETTVDAVIDDLRKLGVDEIRSFLAWFRRQDDVKQRLFIAIFGIAGAAAVKVILTKIFGQVAAIALGGLLAGASWALLVRSFIECEDRL